MSGYQFSEMPSDELEGVLEAFDIMRGAAELLYARHVVAQTDSIRMADLQAAMIAEMTRRAHIAARHGLTGVDHYGY